MDPTVEKLFQNVRRVIMGKDEVIQLAITALISRGHVLVEDVPGLGKTMLARAIAQSIDATFRRVQFTPDLLPSDITGVSVYHPEKQSFELHAGPVFTEVLLADEINRTSPRTQSALLEAMEERQVTIDGISRALPKLFFVMATQNPIELDGTYPLPEAQLDRFLLRLELGYPEAREEVAILGAQMGAHPIDSITPVVNVDDIVSLQHRARAVAVSEEIREYIVALSAATRRHPAVRLGISPRGSLALMHSAQSHSLLHGLPFVTPDSVKTVAPHVFSHRLIVDPHREHTGTSRIEIVESVIAETPVPTGRAATSDASARG